MGPAAKRQKTSKYGVDEVKFDTDARHDFLSGFHRRKQARIRHAQEVGKQKERQAKIEERKELREQRKKDLEEHVKAVNDAVNNVGSRNLDSDEENPATDQVERQDDVAYGLADRQPDTSKDPASTKEDEYVDEEKYTTVTVEPMNDETTEEDAELQNPSRTKRTQLGVSNQPEKSSKTHRQSIERAKKKRKKFRYESKSERKLGKLQQKAKNNRAAALRRSSNRS